MADWTEFKDALNAAVGAIALPMTATKGGAVGEEPFLLAPEGYSLLPLSQYLARPLRKKASANFTSLESFLAYVESQMGDDLLLLANDNTGTVTAVFDYHGDEPNWGEHRAILTLQQTQEWKTWCGASGKAMTQVAFAEFIEDNLPDIYEPVGAEMLEIAKHLEAKKTVSFASGVNLSNGMIQLAYSEQEDGRVKGQVEVPQRFTLQIAPFEHTAPVFVPVRLRYRIVEAKLAFTYIMDRPHKVLEAAVALVLDEVHATTGLKPLIGTATILK